MAASEGSSVLASSWLKTTTGSSSLRSMIVAEVYFGASNSYCIYGNLACGGGVAYLGGGDELLLLLFICLDSVVPIRLIITDFTYLYAVI